MNVKKVFNKAKNLPIEDIAAYVAEALIHATNRDVRKLEEYVFDHAKEGPESLPLRQRLCAILYGIECWRRQRESRWLHRAQRFPYSSLEAWAILYHPEFPQSLQLQLTSVMQRRDILIVFAQQLIEAIQTASLRGLRTRDRYRLLMPWARDTLNQLLPEIEFFERDSKDSETLATVRYISGDRVFQESLTTNVTQWFESSWLVVPVIRLTALAYLHDLLVPATRESEDGYTFGQKSSSTRKGSPLRIRQRVIDLGTTKLTSNEKQKIPKLKLRQTVAETSDRPSWRNEKIRTITPAMFQRWQDYHERTGKCPLPDGAQLTSDGRPIGWVWHNESKPYIHGAATTSGRQGQRLVLYSKSGSAIEQLFTLVQFFR